MNERRVELGRYVLWYSWPYQLQSKIYTIMAVSVWHADCGNIAYSNCCDWNDIPAGIPLSGCLPHIASSPLSLKNLPGRFWVSYVYIGMVPLMQFALANQHIIHSSSFMYVGNTSPAYWCDILVGQTFVWICQFHNIINHIAIHWWMYVH